MFRFVTDIKHVLESINLHSQEAKQNGVSVGEEFMSKIVLDSLRIIKVVAKSEITNNELVKQVTRFKKEYGVILPVLLDDVYLELTGGNTLLGISEEGDIYKMDYTSKDNISRLLELANELSSEDNDYVAELIHSLTFDLEPYFRCEKTVKSVNEALKVVKQYSFFPPSKIQVNGKWHIL